MSAHPHAIPLGHTACDRCDRSELYVCWPTCRCCRSTICPSCYVPKTLDEDEHPTAICFDCVADALCDTCGAEFTKQNEPRVELNMPGEQSYRIDGCRKCLGTRTSRKAQVAS